MRKAFVFKQFAIAQDLAAMPVTTDACIFGALCDFTGKQNLLDIGTGTGLLSLMQAQRFPPLRITAIEPHANSCINASANFKASPWANRIQLHSISLQALKTDTPYDAIVCNPPFFHKQLPSESEQKRAARHTGQLDFETLVKAIMQFLAPEGKACLLIPIIHELAVRQLITNTPLQVTKSIKIKSMETKQPHLVVLELENWQVAETVHEFVTYNADKSYTTQAMALLHPFYLWLGE